MGSILEFDWVQNIEGQLNLGMGVAMIFVVDEWRGGNGEGYDPLTSNLGMNKVRRFLFVLIFVITKFDLWFIKKKDLIIFIN